MPTRVDRPDRRQGRAPRSPVCSAAKAGDLIIALGDPADEVRLRPQARSSVPRRSSQMKPVAVWRVVSTAPSAARDASDEAECPYRRDAARPHSNGRPPRGDRRRGSVANWFRSGFDDSTGPVATWPQPEPYLPQQRCPIDRAGQRQAHPRITERRGGVVQPQPGYHMPGLTLHNEAHDLAQAWDGTQIDRIAGQQRAALLKHGPSGPQDRAGSGKRSPPPLAAPRQNQSNRASRSHSATLNGPVPIGVTRRRGRCRSRAGRARDAARWAATMRPTAARMRGMACQA